MPKKGLLGLVYLVFVLPPRGGCQLVDTGGGSGRPSSLTSVCGGPVTDFPANFASPSYPGRYPPNAHCTWEFAAFPGRKLILTFTNFSLGMTPQCKDEYLEVVDYDATTTYCGHDIPSKIISQYNRLIVNFRSDNNGDEGLYFAGRVEQASFTSDKPCSPNPCQNGAVCTETYDTPEFYVCNCPKGFTGRNCECVDKPCDASTTCGPKAHCMDTCKGAVCVCDDGYFKKGKDCYDVDECSFYSPCSRAAICRNTPGSYTCTCKPGYTGDGQVCDLNIDCPVGWITYPGAESCYLFSDKNETWTQARASCNSAYASLLCVDSTEEMHFIGISATDGNFHWMSHNDANEEGVFACTNGNHGMQPYPWDEHDQEPDGGTLQNCLILYSSFKWGWTNCTSSHSSVCELKSRPCPYDWQSYPAVPGSCYRFIDSFMGYDAARANCRSLHPQADLIVIDSVVESKFVRDTIPRWIGVRRTKSAATIGGAAAATAAAGGGGDSDWRTVQGRKVLYTNWAHPPPPIETEPDLCGVLIKSTWNDAECNSSYHYICERPFALPYV